MPDRVFFHIAPLPRLDSKSIVKNNFVLIVTHNEIKLLCTDKLQHDTVCKQPSAVKAAMRQRAEGKHQRTHKQCLHSQFTWNPKVAKKSMKTNSSNRRQSHAYKSMKTNSSVPSKQCGLLYLHKVTFSSRWPCYPFKLYKKHCWISCWRAHTRLAKTGANITSDVTCQHASISAKLALIFLKGHLSFECILAPRQHKSYCNYPTPYQNWVM